jgi:SAM-dependent methyltransferase
LDVASTAAAGPRGVKAGLQVRGKAIGGNSMFAFFAGLALLSASTLMYEVLLTRLLSALCWYYLAFVSVSVAMFGMTAGALLVQLRPDWFSPDRVPLRLTQATFAMAVSIPLTLLTSLAVPVDVSYALETLYSFLLFSAVLAVPFFFSGIGICLALTRIPFSIGRIYATDLTAASAGCFGALWMMRTIDAPSAILMTSAVVFLGASAFSAYSQDRRFERRARIASVGVLALAVLNSISLHGIQPIWSKGQIDRRDDILAEVWNPVGKVRARRLDFGPPAMKAPAPTMPDVRVQQILLDIDNDADTPVTQYSGDLQALAFLNYDLTSLAPQLRAGGTAAIIGLGGGRDALVCAVNGFRHIVGIELNGAIVRLTTGRFASFDGFRQIPGFEVRQAEGRSYLTRTNEKFDLIQASMVDTWAATTAGAMTLAENSLYTVEAWRIFYEHLKPGGLVSFTRWNRGPEAAQTYRLFSLAWATLLSEGVSDPGSHLALIGNGPLATVLLNDEPFSSQDLDRMHDMVTKMQFRIMFLRGDPTSIPEVRNIVAAHSLRDLEQLRNAGLYDYSPVFDSSPYFFNATHLSKVPALLRQGVHGANLRALLFVFGFLVAAAILVAATVLLPAWRGSKRRTGAMPAPIGAVIYFIAIGLGFILVEMGMMQQLSIFLGHPIYSLAVTLAGLIFSAGFGSLISDRLGLSSSAISRTPPLVAALSVTLYSVAVLPVIHHEIAGLFWQRALFSLGLIAPCGFVMGFCFPMGLRWMNRLGQGDNLPWMWALNGAASVLATFAAVFISMDAGIRMCLTIGAVCYVVAGLFLPARSAGVRPARSG